MTRQKEKGLAFDDTEALDWLKELSQKAEARVDLGAVVHGLMVAFDGPVGFARQIKLDFDANAAGSANRIKIEMQIMGLLQNFQPEDEDYDEDEMEAMARKVQEAMDRKRQEANGNS